jgi:hypothetical protein
MSVRALPSIKRFLQSTAGAMFTSSSKSSDLRRAQDFMIHDFTSSGRFFGR